MEYLDGTNLEELILRDGALPVERALLIAAQITRALEAAHAADIIHRDLKPANVMLINRKARKTSSRCSTSASRRTSTWRAAIVTLR
jgi:serine/threonine-protein kinase